MVVDRVDGWSAHNNCVSISEQIPFEFDIIPAEFLPPEKLAELSEQYDIVHLFFTAGVEKYADIVGEKYVMTIINERSLLDGFEVDKAKLERMICG